MRLPALPVWDNWLFGGDTFTALLLSTRMVWCAGNFGSGKTLMSVFLAAHIVHRGLADGVVSNLRLAGAVPTVEYIPEGIIYESRYLQNKDHSPRRFYAGERYPLEDKVMLVDEAGIFLEDWSSAKDYAAALRKTNLFLLMPSIWPPSARLKMLEVRRSLNWYVFGIPCWQYAWFYTNGKAVSEKGTFLLWRPHRLFGVFDTLGFPKDDGNISEMLRYTHDVGQIDDFRRQRKVARTLSTLGGDSESIRDSITELEEQLDRIPTIRGGKRR